MMRHTIDAVRRFNRFFTRHVGALNDRFLETDANLPEARLLLEIGTRAPVGASELQGVLDLDRGYLSRLVMRLEKRGWVERDRMVEDGRVRPIRLTASGCAALEQIDTRQRDAVVGALAPLDRSERCDLVHALSQARLLLEPRAEAVMTLRTLQPGDLGWIASRQAKLYEESQGWGRPLETLLLRTTAEFAAEFRAGRDQGWIAELDGAAAGAVLLSDEADRLGAGIARLRLLHVESFARRRGLGEALIGETIAFAREVGYREISLWTHEVLEGARRLYARAGFEHVSSALHHEMGAPVMGETWRLRLPPVAPQDSCGPSGVSSPRS